MKFQKKMNFVRKCRCWNIDCSFEHLNTISMSCRNTCFFGCSQKYIATIERLLLSLAYEINSDNAKKDIRYPHP